MKIGEPMKIEVFMQSILLPLTVTYTQSNFTKLYSTQIQYKIYNIVTYYGGLVYVFFPLLFSSLPHLHSGSIHSSSTHHSISPSALCSASHPWLVTPVLQSSNHHPAIRVYNPPAPGRLSLSSLPPACQHVPSSLQTFC